MLQLITQLVLFHMSMIFLLKNPFRLVATMLNETGSHCQVRTTNWRFVFFCIIGLMHTINCNNPSCVSGDCDDDAIQLLRHERRLSIQQREYALMQKQKEIQLQLQKLYLEQHQLETELNDTPVESEVNSGLEYEIPSYCANCLGDAFESSTKSSLSSEYSRKNSEPIEELNQQLPLSDHGRLEAIKFQILLKLGLKNKPNVTNTLPKQFIFDTLRRSGDPVVNDFTMLLQSSDSKDTRDLVLDQLQHLKMNNDSIADELKAEDLKESPLEDDQEFDDFYGRTREIIAFADKGE